MVAAITIKERRSIRKYNETPVAQALVISLLKEAASLYEAEGAAPCWRCIYYGTEASRLRLAESMVAKVRESGLGKLIPAKMVDMITKQAMDVPVQLIFIAEPGENERARDEHYAAVCSIMQNLQLLGWEQGLGMFWYTDPMVYSASFYKEIGLQDGERLAGILNMGYFDKIPRARRRTPAEKKWTEIGGGMTGSAVRANQARISSAAVLEVLNEAVWAPNDEMREPWRFIYVSEGDTAAEWRASSASNAEAFLVVVAKEEADLHKQEEDYAAVCCLIQNFQLLAKYRQWPVRRSIPAWTYDEQWYKRLGVLPRERIVAVLELGGEGETISGAEATDLRISYR
ncbi:nitroreductase family protein [Paenibacillus cisolokensis]|uniref:nitroreductase family protein n=1 Tax=Paenibacillus cisolokensis TaxID=1658519 RepID=UPI003D2E83D4